MLIFNWPYCSTANGAVLVSNLKRNYNSLLAEYYRHLKQYEMYDKNVPLTMTKMYLLIKTCYYNIRQASNKGVK